MEFGRAGLGPYSSTTTFPIDVSRTTNGASFSVNTILHPTIHQPTAPIARTELFLVRSRAQRRRRVRACMGEARTC